MGRIKSNVIIQRIKRKNTPFELYRGGGRGKDRSGDTGSNRSHGSLLRGKAYFREKLRRE